MLAYTIVSRAYVPQARVLARSYARHHGGAKLWALLIDDGDRTFDAESEPFHILHLEDLALEVDEIHRMEMLFSGQLIAVIKPWVFEYFLDQGAERVMYLDGDCVMYNSLSPIAESAGDGVILVPHVLEPMPRDGNDPNETTILGAGMFNAGMFGVGQNHGGFLEFLKVRLRRECIFDASRQRFNEQRWLDFVPSLFPHHIVRDPGVDVAYWNLHERNLEKRGDQWFAGGAPLRAFHFSSFDPRASGVGGRYELDPHPRVKVATDPLFAELCEEYRRELLANGFDDLHDLPFHFDSLADGSPIYHTLRTLFREAVLAGDRDGGLSYPPDPYQTKTVPAFKAWLKHAYEELGIAFPHRMGNQPQSSPRGFARLRKTVLSKEPSQPPRTGTSHWSVDWLGRMIVDGAAERTPVGAIHVHANRTGFVCHGPRAALDPGHYMLTLEWDPGVHGGSALPGDQVLVVEGFVQGYVVGSRAATVAEIQTGEVHLPMIIPQRFAQEALLFGLEMRLLTRGGLDAQLTAVMVDFVGTPDGSENQLVRADWLPVMAGGTAGQRQGSELITIAGHSGVVVSGPNWRLIPGRYRIDLHTRAGSELGESRSDVAILEAVVGETVLSQISLTAEDLIRGSTHLEFSVLPGDSGPDDQVGVKLRALAPIDWAVTSLVLEMLDEHSAGAVTVA